MIYVLKEISIYNAESFITIPSGCGWYLWN